MGRLLSWKWSFFCVALSLGLASMQGCAASVGAPGQEETTTIQQSTGGNTTGVAGGSGGAPLSTAGAKSAGAGGTPGGGGSPAVTGAAGAVGSAGSAGIPSGGASNSNAAGGSASTVPLTSFGQVTALLGTRCAGSKCHGSGGKEVPIANTTGAALHTLLTTPMASSVPHCVGVTLVVPNDANSPLLKIVASGGKISCTKPKAESEGPMPEKCSTTSLSATGKCLTAAEIKTLSDWILAGAPQN